MININSQVKQIITACSHINPLHEQKCKFVCCICAHAHCYSFLSQK
uniref:Uncharacterized protein n=1 Tax=Rhizophora mucronata TaxID=61149 RepID=A0A2P2NC18_RHIMU